MGKGDGDFLWLEQAGIIRIMCLDMPSGTEVGFAFMRYLEDKWF